MARRSMRYLVLGLVTAGCAPGGPGSAGAEPPASSIGPRPGETIRTANPYDRGLTDADFPRVTRLADGVYTYEQLRSAGDERFTTVSLFVVTPAGVLVADGQGNVAETGRLIETIAKYTDRPVTHVVICSDHGDHTGGNSVFPASATVFAHPTSQAVIAASARNPGRSAGAPPVVVPGEVVPERRVIRLGGREIHLLFLGRAHTGGDLHVYLPAEKILFMSEAFLHRVFPAMRSAYPSEWVEVIDRALAMDVDVYVPGHGFVDSPATLALELATFQNAIKQVIAEARRLHARGVAVDEAVAQARFGDLESWSLRSSQAAIAIRRVYLELDGALR